MHKEIRKYCNHIKKVHIEVLRLDKNTGVRYWDYPACATVCHDGAYQRTARGYAHKPQGTKWVDVLRRKMERLLGHIGDNSRLEPHHYIVGNCAEQHAGNKYMHKYHEVNTDNLYFTESVRPRTMEVMQPCENCKTMFNTLNH